MLCCSDLLRVLATFPDKFTSWVFTLLSYRLIYATILPNYFIKLKRSKTICYEKIVAIPQQNSLIGCWYQRWCYSPLFAQWEVCFMHNPVQWVFHTAHPLSVVLMQVWSTLTNMISGRNAKLLQLYNLITYLSLFSLLITQSLMFINDTVIFYEGSGVVGPIASPGGEGKT